MGQDNAQPAFYWKDEILPDQRIRRSQLIRSSKEATQIHFDYDLLSGDLISKQVADERLEILSAPPGKHLWAPHEEFEMTLEDHFELIQKDLPTNWESLVREVINLIHETEEAYIPESVPGISFLKSAVQKMDFIEPIRTKFASDDTRVDAFNLSPLLALQKNGDEMLQAISDFARSGTQYPLHWFVRTAGKFSDESRLVCLMLITHNHLAEDYFLKGVIIRYGKSRAWQIAIDLNEIYSNEREFWKFRHGFKPELTKFYETSEFDFLNRRLSWEVDMHPERRISWPLDKKMTSPKNLDRHGVPYKQTYHYYGAFIAAWRMSHSLSLPSFSIVPATEALGLTYKAATAGWKPDQLDLMRSIYRFGARDAIWIQARLMNLQR